VLKKRLKVYENDGFCLEKKVDSLEMNWGLFGRLNFQEE